MPAMTVMLAILLSAAAMTAIVGVRYLIVSGAFAAATRMRHPGLYTGLDRQMRREIVWSLASAAIYGVPAGVVAWGWQNHGWTRIYTDIHAYPLWYAPLSVLLYLVAHDTWFYWTHRWMHRPGPFKLAHALHHASRPPTAWAAMAFHPIEALTGAVVIPLRAGGSTDGDDRYGCDQSHGLGNVSGCDVARAPRGVADHGEPSPASS
jgi:lathosterol oxidase